DLRERFSDVEILDLGTGGPNTLILDSNNVVRLSGTKDAGLDPNTVLVKGDSDDLLAFGDSGWLKGSAQVDPFGQSGTYVTWTNGSLTVLVQEGVAVSSSNIDIPSLSTTQGFRMTGATVVGSAGDVNGDGIDDVIVGAPAADVTAG